MIKTLVVAFAFAMALSPIAEAKKPASPEYAQQREPNEAELQSHGHYKNKDGKEIHSPSKSNSGKAPQGASAQCRDGSYSFSTHHRGTCSRHGGVSLWLQ